MSEREPPRSDDAAPAIPNLIDTKAVVEKRHALAAERKAREKEIRRRYRGPERNAKLRELAEEIDRRLKEIVDGLLERKGD